MSTLPLIGFPRAATFNARDIQNRWLVQQWLYFVALMVFALVVVGGATRLAEAGLSITEWKPIHGIIPPLSLQEWQEEFDLYRQIPQYQLINRGMRLGEFQVIFWWEWAHRFLARAVGFVFALPLAFFWLTGRIENRLKPRLLVLLALGGLQGAIGWWMVASGLVERTDVSQYRLAIHLTLACVIFAAILWVAQGLDTRQREAPPTTGSPAVGKLIVLLVLAQIYLGGLVAGLNAGLTFNTWPLMDGQWIPANLLRMSPVWVNFFENVMTVQFMHRLGAYVLTVVVVVHAIAAYAIAPRSSHARGALLVVALVLTQAGIGVATLLMMVPVGWALLHQASAVAVLTGVVIHARALAKPYPAPVAA